MMRSALDILTKKLSKVISNLKAFSLQWKGTEIDIYLVRASIYLEEIFLIATHYSGTNIGLYTSAECSVSLLVLPTLRDN